MRAATRIRGDSDAGAAKAALPSCCVGQRIGFDELTGNDRLDDQLCDPVATAYLDGRLRIEVDEDDLDLTPIVTVDKPRSVHKAQALLQGEPASGLDETCVPVRYGEGDARAHQCAPERGNLSVLGGPQIQAGIAFMGV